MPVRPSIQASDVVFMYAPEPAQYDIYAGTVTAWGGRARSLQPRDVEAFRAQVNEAKKRRIRYCASVDFLVDFGGFIDFRPEGFMDAVCRDLDGNPLRVPWLHDHSHKGHPAYWFCTNNPDYRAYLMEQVRRACVAPIDGLHIDDYRGTFACASWNGGCFCEHCMKGFRDYLRRTRGMSFPSQGEAEQFDYRQYLRRFGVTAQKFRANPREAPLGEQFLNFQREQMMELVRQVFEQAEQTRSKLLLRSVNSSASSAEAVLIEPLVDYFCGEVEHHASSGTLSQEPIFVYRVVEAFGKRQTATATGWDWAWIAANNKPGMVRAWIAQAYAFGSAFMVPHNQWCYTPDKGTHWWRGKPEDFAFLYRFVREHHYLLDDYHPLTNTVLDFDETEFEEAKRIAIELIIANVPFAVKYWERLIEHVAKGVPRDSSPVPAYWSMRDDSRRWRGIADLSERSAKQVRVESEGVFVVSPRQRVKRGRYPVVCHLLNRDYDRERDAVNPADVSVSLLRDLLPPGFNPRQADLFTPGQKPRRVPVKRQGEHIVFEVKGAGLWTVAALV